MSMTKQQKQGAFLLGSFVLPLAGFVFGCKQEPDDPKPQPTVCECPNGTNHPDAPCGCGADDCTCTNNPIENPQLRDATINVDLSALGGEAYTATVRGTLLAAQWEGLAARIEAVIQKNISLTNNYAQAVKLQGVFYGNKTVIVVKKDAANQVSVLNKYLVEFDFDYLAGQSNEALAESFFDVIAEMSDAPVPEVAKVKAVGSKAVIADFTDNAARGGSA